MVRLVIVVLAMSISSLGSAQALKDSIRAVYLSINDEAKLKSAIDFYDGLVKSEKHKMAESYFAAATSMMAEYVFAPWSKLNYFNSGVDLLESNINQMKSFDNIFLRLMIQVHAPGMLNYNKNIEEDLEFIVKNYESQIYNAYREAMVLAVIEALDDEKQKEMLNELLKESYDK